jgi:RNA polymerase sigma factor (sigma-70 family)
MAEKKKYTLLVRGQRVEVSPEVYKAYYQAYEQERYAKDKALDVERSLDRFAEDGVNVEYQYAMSQPSLEDRVFHKQMKKKLPTVLDALTDEERKLVYELFYNGKSERQLAAQCGIPQRTLNDHKHRIMNKLKTLLES